MKNEEPSVTFITPTLNSEKVIGSCLRGISIQDYPKNKVKVFIIDGGSEDKTLDIARKFGATIIQNKKVIAEYGKATGIKKCKTDYFILLDSDNLIKDKNWLRKMIKPILNEEDIIGVESKLGVSEDMPLLDRYSALMRTADPLARMFVSKPKRIKKDGYSLAVYKKSGRIASGANGFLWNYKLVKKYWKDKNIFEEANFCTYLCSKGFCVFAIPNDTYVYHYHISSLKGFIKKRKKISGKFLKRKEAKKMTWLDNLSNSKKIYSILYCFSIILPFLESIKNMIRDKDVAWIIHPVACFITASLYSYYFIKWKINLGR